MRPKSRITCVAAANGRLLLLNPLHGLLEHRVPLLCLKHLTPWADTRNKVLAPHSVLNKLGAQQDTGGGSSW